MIVFQAENENIIWLHGIRKIFDVPDNVKEVDIQLHNRPSLSRHKVSVVTDDKFGDEFPKIDVNGKLYGAWEDERWDKGLRSLEGKTLYLQILYSEE